jgi:AAA+ superfamily predicted ATPase
MEIKLYADMLNQFPDDKREQFDIQESEIHYCGYTEFDLSKYGIRELKTLLKIFSEMKDDYNRIDVIIKSLKHWIDIISDESYGTKIERLIDFKYALENYLLDHGHRIHKKVDPELDYYDCYLVTQVEYYPRERNSSGEWMPEYVTMRFVHEKFGERFSEQTHWYSDDVIRKSVPEILLRDGYEKETDDLRKKYLKYYDEYQGVIRLIGKQFTASGVGKDDVPSEFSERHAISYGGGTTFKFSGEDKVVIDIFRDDQEEFEPTRVDTNSYYWEKLKKRTGVRKIDFSNEDNYYRNANNVKVCEKCNKTTRSCKCVEEIYDEEPRDDDGYQIVNEIPIHCYCVVFDLKRHMRLSVHVKGLKEYEFDKNLHEKLILPENIKELVRLLIKHKDGNFVDIIKGKSGGAILLLTGKAGVGKTLTAEVFAEASGKPLYNIQASQLGTNPDEIESLLRNYIRRASRWDAIMLIDEADVYIHVRGNDLQQNAIVGVLLRVLEYHTATMFLTTNRPDLVDDAIASRCVARIDYNPPSLDEQKKIWKILAEQAKVKIDHAEIDEFVESNNDFSGRDIKNILKLAHLQSLATEKPITTESIKYISQFNSTTVKNSLEVKK